ncbi:hypothetical protein BDZ45DRAFT_140344 [Acephala macrosclerotiorum]|nr:hypothetical protein BDZ45DRAFT_140344 [Acephala macrosclerotiorum]
MSATSFVMAPHLPLFGKYIEQHKVTICYSNYYMCCQGVTHAPRPLQSLAECKQTLKDRELIIRSKEERRGGDARFYEAFEDVTERHTKTRTDL